MNSKPLPSLTPKLIGILNQIVKFTYCQKSKIDNYIVAYASMFCLCMYNVYSTLWTVIISSISQNLTELQCIYKPDFGKVLWNRLYKIFFFGGGSEGALESYEVKSQQCISDLLIHDPWINGLINQFLDVFSGL